MDEGLRQDIVVSVVVPAYNAAAYLDETLHAIVASDYPHFEVVVVDDGSTDATLRLAQEWAQREKRVRVFTQSNQGVCATRNRAIREARGRYILPVDADNRIAPHFMGEAVQALDAHPEVKACVPRAEFFGARSGEWRLPPFSLPELARHNIMDTCALYRREDWERVGGYDESIIAREDWAFWIAVLKGGGQVMRSERVGLFYRVQAQSKRTRDRQLKSHVVATLNRLHPDFFEQYLGGPLRQMRSWSRLFNLLYRCWHPRRFKVAQAWERFSYFVKALPRRFALDTGQVIFKNRNEIRQFDFPPHSFVVKEFRVPNLINRIAYGLLRKSKARRSFEYAQMLRAAHIGTPEPVAYLEERSGLLFTRSYYVSLRSSCPLPYMALMDDALPHRDDYLRHVAQVAAQLHERGWLHSDFSRGNILLRREADGSIHSDLLDLNRIRFRKVDREQGCKNFLRLPATPAMLRTLAEAYAEARGFDAEACLRIMQQYHTGER